MESPTPKRAEATSADQLDQPSLSKSDKVEIVLRSGLELVPMGIGAALGQLYWGGRDKRWQRKIDDTTEFLRTQLAITAADVERLKEYYSSDGFAALFEGCWTQIRKAAQSRQLLALRGALLSILERRPDFGQAKSEAFVHAIERLADMHIYALQLYQENARSGELGGYLVTYRLFQHLGAGKDADQQFVYGAIDTLANLRFVEHGNIPRLGGPNGPIDFSNQTFRLTSFGADFLDFIRIGPATVEKRDSRKVPHGPE